MSGHRTRDLGLARAALSHLSYHPELLQPALCGAHSNHNAARKFGGDDRVRTGDPLHAMQVLSHLSYIPVKTQWLGREDSNLRMPGSKPGALTAWLHPTAAFSICVAERTGLEPATSGVTGQHSNQLNYRSLYTKPTIYNNQTAVGQQ